MEWELRAGGPGHAAMISLREFVIWEWGARLPYGASRLLYGLTSHDYFLPPFVPFRIQRSQAGGNAREVIVR